MNGKNNELNRELISAHLDDALTGSERQYVEHLLATDTQAAHYHEQLRSTRDCVKSLAGSSLRSSFADRVLSQARRQALSDGLSADHHVLRAASATALPNLAEVTAAQSIPTHGSRAAEQVIPASRDVLSIPTLGRSWLPRSNRILWSAALATAAAILCMVAVPNFFTDPAPQSDPLLSQVLPDGTGPVVELPVTGGPASAVASNGEPSPFQDVASAAEPDRLQPGRVTDRHVLDSEQPMQARKSLNKDLQPLNPVFDYVLIVDVVMSEQAWQSNYFSQLLDRAGVPMMAPIVADEELTTLLDESRVTVRSAASATSNGRAALLFIRAEGKAVDGLLSYMSSDRAHFPAVSYDMGIDEEDKLLTDLLRKQSIAQEGADLGARVVKNGRQSLVSETLVPEFTPGAPPKPIDPALDVENLGAQSLTALDSLNSASPVVEVLIVLRQPR